MSETIPIVIALIAGLAVGSLGMCWFIMSRANAMVGGFVTTLTRWRDEARQQHLLIDLQRDRVICYKCLNAGGPCHDETYRVELEGRVREKKFQLTDKLLRHHGVIS